MALFVDARTPVLLLGAEELGAEELGAEALPTLSGGTHPLRALVVEEGGDDAATARVPSVVARESFTLPETQHLALCLCCGGRGPVAQALDRLFLARVRNAVPWFTRVVLVVHSAAGRAEAEATLVDPVIGSRFRLATPSERDA